MHIPENIQLNIDNPCDKSWAEMTPDGSGRHCAHCSKTVVDFTNWSDTAIHHFFTEHKTNVCGRFLQTQLQRTILPPPKPHGILYRGMVALGLTLIFTPATLLYAHNYRAPLVARTLHDALPVRDTTSGKGSTISGKVINELGRALAGVTVELGIGRTTLALAYTDSLGMYTFKNVAAGVHNIRVDMQGYDLFTSDPVMLIDEHDITLDVMLLARHSLGENEIFFAGDVAVNTDHAPVLGKLRAPDHREKKKGGLSLFLRRIFGSHKY